MVKSSQSEKEKIMHILSNKHRLAILETLLGSKKKLCVGEISALVKISQALTSQHMSYLTMQGVTSSERRWRTVCYTLNDSLLTKKVSKIIEIL